MNNKWLRRLYRTFYHREAETPHSAMLTRHHARASLVCIAYLQSFFSDYNGASSSSKIQSVEGDERLAVACSLGTILPVNVCTAGD